MIPLMKSGVIATHSARALLRVYERFPPPTFCWHTLRTPFQAEPCLEPLRLFPQGPPKLPCFRAARLDVCIPLSSKAFCQADPPIPRPPLTSRALASRNKRHSIVMALAAIFFLSLNPRLPRALVPTSCSFSYKSAPSLFPLYSRKM